MNELSEKLEECFGEILEDTALVFVEPCDDRSSVDMDGAEFYRVDMSFSGDAEGQLTLVASMELASEIAAVSLGLEPGEDEAKEHAVDALSETLNVVCGRLLTDVAGHEAEFELSPPQCVELDDAEWTAMRDNEANVVLETDSGPVFLVAFSDSLEQLSC